MFEEAEAALNKAAALGGTVPDLTLGAVAGKRTQLHKAAGLAVTYIGNDKVPASAAPRLAELAAALWLVAPVPLPKIRGQQIGRARGGGPPEFDAWIEGKPPQEIDQFLSQISSGAAGEVGRPDGDAAPLTQGAKSAVVRLQVSFLCCHLFNGLASLPPPFARGQLSARGGKPAIGPPR
jgi:hypothetical protein